MLRDLPIPPNLATAFLSHSSVDKDLVRAVRRQLGRFGIASWLDVDELAPGVDLDSALAAALATCRVVAAFISPASVRSPWVRDELALALNHESEGAQRVVPVFLGDALELVRSTPSLAAQWMHPERDQVNRLGVSVKDRDPRRIAEELTRAVLRTLDWPPTGSPGLVIDQRGADGDRVGMVPSGTVDALFTRGAGPILVTRPDDGPRTPDETLTGSAFQRWWADIWWSLGQLRRLAPGGLSRVRLAGAGQLGLAWALGEALDRTSRVELTCFPRPNSGPRLSNAGQDFMAPLTGGDADRAAVAPELGVPPLPSGPLPVVDLLLLPENPVYLDVIRTFRASDAGAGAAVWIKTEVLTSSEQAMALVRDVIATLGRLRQERGTSHVRVFTALPFHFLPLLSSNLTHVVLRTTFMEYVRARGPLGAPAMGGYFPVSP